MLRSLLRCCAALAVVLTAAHAASPTPKPIRIAVLKFSHETVSFLKSDTTIDDFTYPGSPARGEALLNSGRNGYMGGFVQVAREYAGVELVGIESPLDSKRSSGSGYLTRETFEHFVGIMLRELKEQGPFDGVYLSLHGAMAVRGIDRPEAELARRVREVVGPQARLAGTFDLHGNEDDQFLRYADFAFCVKYYPHYDSHLQGQRAARMLIRSIRGDYRPVSATRKPPIHTATVLQWTGRSPWMDLVQRALVWEARLPDVYVNCFFGFGFSDAVDGGMCFQVMTNGDADLAQYIANDMAMTAWRRREELCSGTPILTHAEAVAQARTALAADRWPVVLADHSDRTGYATWLLDQIVRQDLSHTLIGTIADKPLIEKLRARGVKPGDAFDEEVGGLVDESAGRPVRIRGVVQVVGDGSQRGDELWVGVKFGRDNVLLISPNLVQIIDPFAFRRLGLDPADFKAFAIKSRVHFRRGFDDNGFAKTILICEPEQPFLGTVKVDALPFEHLEVRKLYPYNKAIEYIPEGWTPKLLEGGNDGE
jgi:microcystin degradation protein MlrC